MRWAMFSAGVLLTLAAARPSAGQGKKKLPALAFDAVLVKLDQAKGIPTKLYYEVSEKTQKRIGFRTGDAPVNKGTRFIFVGPDGEKVFNHKNVLADEQVSKHLQKDSKIRVQVSGVEVEEVRFGPNLKPKGIQRVR